jgi:hypothetical protein
MSSISASCLPFWLSIFTDRKYPKTNNRGGQLWIFVSVVTPTCRLSCWRRAPCNVRQDPGQHLPNMDDADALFLVVSFFYLIYRAIRYLIIPTPSPEPIEVIAARIKGENPQQSNCDTTNESKANAKTVYPQYTSFEIATKRTPHWHHLFTHSPESDIWQASVIGYDSGYHQVLIASSQVHDFCHCRERNVFEQLDTLFRNRVEQARERARLNDDKYKWQVYGAETPYSPELEATLLNGGGGMKERQ